MMWLAIGFAVLIVIGSIGVGMLFAAVLDAIFSNWD